MVIHKDITVNILIFNSGLVKINYFLVYFIKAILSYYFIHSYLMIIFIYFIILFLNKYYK